MVIDHGTTGSTELSRERRDLLKAELHSMRQRVRDYMSLHYSEVAGKKEEIRARTVIDTNRDLAYFFADLENDARRLCQSSPFVSTGRDPGLGVMLTSFERLSRRVE